jgi:hypothetical protein
MLSCGGLLTADDIERHTTSRIGRRESVLNREDPPQLIAVLGEAVLHRMIGGASVMRDQLKDLLDMAERPNLHLHILPNDAHENAGLSGSFILARLPEGGELGHLDTPLRAVLLEQVEDIAALQRRWESLRSDCLPERQSIQLIREAAETWTT